MGESSAKSAATFQDDNAPEAEMTRPGQSLLDRIGNTPLLRFDRLTTHLPGVTLLGKAEWYNPGGSVKDRAAANIVAEGRRSGQLTPGSNPVDSRIIRMSPLISPLKDPAGNWSALPPMTDQEFVDLANLDMDAVEQLQAESIFQYAGLWLRDVAPNQPIRMDGDTLIPEIGHPTFSAARNAWSAIK